MNEINNTAAQKLYKALISNGYTQQQLGDEQVFLGKMQDSTNRKQLYDFVSRKNDIGSYDDYESRLTTLAPEASPTAQEKKEKSKIKAPMAARPGMPARSASELEQVTLPATPAVPKNERIVKVTGVEGAISPTPPADVTAPLAPPEQVVPVEQPDYSVKIPQDVQELMDSIAQTPEMSTISGQIRVAEKKLAELNNKLVEVRSNVQYPFDMSKVDMRYAASMQENYQNKDPMVQACKVAIKEYEDYIDRLKRELKRRSGENIGLFHGAGDKLTDIDFYTFGITDLAHQLDKKNAYESLSKDGVDEAGKAALQEMLEATHDKEAAEQEYPDSFLYDTGKMTMDMIPFMAEFSAFRAVTKGATRLASKGAAKVSSKIISEQVTKQASKTIAEKGVKAYIKEAGAKGIAKQAGSWAVKATGNLVDDFANGILMANTIQVPATAADAINRKYGEVIVKDDGTFDFENSKTWGEALWAAEANASVQNISEMGGSHVDLGNTAKALLGNTKLAKWFSASKFGTLLSNANAQGLVSANNATKEIFKSMGISGYVEEVGEEYYGQLLSTILGLEDAYMEDENSNKINLFKSSKWNGDLWAGMGISMGAMGLAKGGFTAARYTKYKLDVNKADKAAQSAFAEGEWQPLKQLIDATTYDDIGDLTDALMGAEDMSKEQKMASLDYIGRLSILRGFNLASIAESKGGERNQDYIDLNQAYLDGYNAMSNFDLAEIQESYESLRQRLIDTVGEEQVMAMEVGGFNPGAALSYINMQRKWTDEQKAIAKSYLDAAMTRNGMMQHARDCMDAKLESDAAMVRSRVNKQSGMIQTATMSTDGREVYIMDGDVNTGESIVVKDAVTGQLEMVSPKMIGEVKDPVDPQETIDSNKQLFQAQFAQEFANIVDNVATFNQGDTYNTYDENNNPNGSVTVVPNAQGVIDNGDGTVNVTDGEKVYAVGKDVLQRNNDIARRQRVESFRKKRNISEAAPEQEQQPVQSHYELSDEVTLRDDSGNLVHGRIVADDGEGNFQVEFDSPFNGSTVVPLNTQELDALKAEPSVPAETEAVVRESPNENQMPRIGRSLSEEESDSLVAAMERTATQAEEIELTPEIWEEQFGDGRVVETPVGGVKMGEHQLEKLFMKKRMREFGMIKPTLTSPDIVIEKNAPEEGAERNSKYLFVKSFIKADGSRIVHFESVSVLRDGMEVSISSHEAEAKDIKKDMQNGKILHISDKLSLSSDGSLTKAQESAEGSDLVPASDNSQVSESKDNENSQSSKASDTIPRNKKGELLYEQAESADLAWDALVERANGDEAMAQAVADNMVKAKEKALSNASKGSPESAEGQFKKQEKVNAITEELEAWKKIANVRASRQSAADAERRRAAQEVDAARRAEEERLRAEREEAERVEREQLNGVPDMADDKPQDARARGFRRVSGNMVTRQEPVQHLQGKSVSVKFSNDTTVDGHVAVIEVPQLQPSHIQGQRNPAHFIDEAQPKERNDEVSVESARRIAANIRPEEITSSVTAYTGAPTVNARGEVIQGNNRGDALRYMWGVMNAQAAFYKKYLIDHATEFGLDAEQIEAMQAPVLVNMLDVDDAQSISLGQYVAQDTESGGIERIKPKNAVKKMGKDMSVFADMLLRATDDETSFSSLVDANGADVLRWMNQKGYITDTQYKSAFDSKGAITAETKNDLKGIMFQSIFEGGNTRLEEMFNAMPAKAQRAILATAFRDFDSPKADRMIGEIQDSIRAYYSLSMDADFMAAKNWEEARQAVENWKKQYVMDDVTGDSYLPSGKFSNFALYLATMYKGQTQSLIQGTFNKLYDLIQGTQEENLFESPDNTPRTLAEAIKETLGIDYNGQLRSDVLADDSSAGEGRQSGSSGNLDAGERSQAQESAADDRGGVGGDSGRSRTSEKDRGNQGQKTQGKKSSNEIKGSLSAKEAEDFIAEMELDADIAPEIELTIENWDALFSDGTVSTPIGDVKMGEHQFAKLMRKGRDGKLGMIKPTLEHPQAIIEDKSIAEGEKPMERSSSYVFIRSFKKEDGSRFYYFTSITVSKEGKEVVISSQEKSRNRISRLLQEGSVIWRTPKDATTSSAERQGLDYKQSLEAETATKGSEITPQRTSSESKGSENSVKDNNLSEKIAEAEAKVDVNPTDAQKEAGNYKKGHVQVGPFVITIEQPKGSVRRGVDANGKSWETKMNNTYGYIRGTEGVDGDHIDVFLADEFNRDWKKAFVYIVDQYNEDGTFDEHKVMLGFTDIAKAKDAYLSNYEKGWEKKHRIDISTTTLDEFKKWIDSSHRKTKPFHEYASVVTEGDTFNAGKVEKPAKSIPNYQYPAILRDAYRKNDAAEIEKAENGIREYIEATENLKPIVATYYGAKEFLRNNKGKDEASNRTQDFIANTCKDVLLERGVPKGVFYNEGARAKFAKSTTDSKALELLTVVPSMPVRLEVIHNPATSVETLKQIADKGLPREKQEAQQVLEERGIKLQKSNGPKTELSPEEIVLRDAINERLRSAGIDVIEDVDAGQQVLDEGNGKVRMSEQTSENITEISRRFDDELQQQVDGTLAKGHIYQLGMPSDVLLSCGFPNMPIELSSTNLAEHAKKTRHPFVLDDVKGLVEALQRPIAVFSYGDKNKSQNAIVEIQKDGRNFLVGIHFNQELNGVEVSSIRGIFPKDNAEWLNWITQGKSIYLDKAKIQTLIDQQRKNLADVEYLDLDSVTKVLNDFENPIVEEIDGQIREHRVYHGSGAEFEAFDHSHMGEGEGAQAYGWGTYVTEVEGIGMAYANAKRNIRYVGDEQKLEDGLQYRYAVSDVIKDIIGIMNRGETFETAVKSLSSYYRNSFEPTHATKREALFRLKPDDFVTGRNLYTVEVPEEKEGNYLRWESVVENGLREIIIKQLASESAEKDSGIDVDYFTDTIDAYEDVYNLTGGALYNILAQRAFNDNPRAASEFLSRAGFIGVSMPAQATTGGRADGARNYVIFNEKDAKITDHVRFFRTAKGEAYGFTVGGKIYIDPRIATAETPIHEYAHLWAASLRQGNAEEWKNVVELMKGTPVWDEVKEQYKELKEDDDIADEVLAQYSGRRGVERLREVQRRIAQESGKSTFEKAEAISALERVKDALKRFWKAVADFLHIHYTSAEEVADRVLSDLLEGVNPKVEARKSKQLDRINETNPMLDDYHTGIRSTKDIRTLREAIQDARDEANGDWDELSAYPDVDNNVYDRALESGKITVYSSKPIKDGTFITPSKMQAEEYAGGGRVYSKQVDVDKVAWITTDEGQMAPTLFADEKMPLRFQFVGEKGAKAMDKAEEATVRLDNLNVAREMENEFNAKKERIEKLRKSEPIVVTGEEYNGKYELNNKDAARYILKSLRGEYVNADTGAVIKLSRRGAEKVTRHDAESDIHLKSIAYIPQMIEKSIYIDEVRNEKDKNGFDSYRYYVVGLKIGGVDYTAKLVVGVKGSESYYDHALTQIEKTDLINNIDLIKRRFDENEVSASEYKDKRLLSILQTDEKENARKIKLATGWERGADGKWKYEILDGKFNRGGNLHPERYRLTEDELQFLEDNDEETMSAFEKGSMSYDKEITEDTDMADIYVAGGMERKKAERIVALEEKERALRDVPKYLDDYIDNEELFKAYPQLRDVRVVEGEANSVFSGRLGGYSQEANTIVLNWLNLDTLVHEVQHVIQGIEGFAKGGTQSTYKNHLASLKDKHDAWLVREELIEKQKELKDGSTQIDVYNALRDDYLSDGAHWGEGIVPSREAFDKGFNLWVRGYDKEGYEDAYNEYRDLIEKFGFGKGNNRYKELSGEVESRNVEKRLGMNVDERRRLLAAETEDVAREDQIILRDAFSGSQESRVPAAESNSVQIEMAEIKTAAESNGLFMMAPNGSRTKLTEQQWLQVRTKAFKKWFGDWELANLYNRAIESWSNKDSKGKVVIGLSDRAKYRFNELLGTNVRQFVITDDAIRHIKKHHSEKEELRGQKNMTPEDVVILPYLVNNFDSMALNPEEDDKKGNRAIEVRKRINGVSVVGTIERGKEKEFLVTNYQFVKSDALGASNETSGLNVRNDSDLAKVQQEIEIIKEMAKNCSKVVDDNGEPLIVYHVSSSQKGFTVFDSTKGFNAEAIWHAKDKGVAAHWGGTIMPKRFDEYLSDKLKALNSVRDILAFASENLGFKYSLEKDGEGGYFVISDYGNGVGSTSTLFYGLYEDVDTIDEDTGEVIGSYPRYKRKVAHTTEEVIEGLKQDLEHIVFERERPNKGIYYDFLNLRNPLIVDAKENTYHQVPFNGEKVNTEYLATYARQNGYDGVIVRNVLETNFENQKTNDYISFTSSQIKSATDNLGNFDSENPDIRFRNAGRTAPRTIRQKEMGKAVLDLAGRLHLGHVSVLTSTEGLEGDDRFAQGFYRPSTGEIVIVLPNNDSIEDAVKTLLHEGVAHYGLREMFGDSFNIFLDNIYEAASVEVRNSIVALMKKNGWDPRLATEEYLAQLAENENFEQVQKNGLWEKVKQFFRELLESLGVPGYNGTITDNELRYILWRSYENLSNDSRSPIGKAVDMTMQRNLKVGRNEETEDGANKVLYRKKSNQRFEEITERQRYENDIKSGLYQAQEALQDHMLSVKSFTMAVLGDKNLRIEELRDFENAYVGENDLSSRNWADAREYAKKFTNPLYKEVERLAATENEKRELMDYLFAKHGLERNEHMAKREAARLRAKRQSEYDGELKSGRMSKQEYDEKVKDLDAYEQQVYTGYDYTDKNGVLRHFKGTRQRDYSGLTALTEQKDVRQAEAVAADMVKEFESAHETKKLWELINAATKETLRKLFDGGLMSKAQYESVKGMYKYYVPLRGFDMKVSEDVYAYLSPQGNTFTPAMKKAEGRNTKADNPFAFIESMAESAIMQSNRNKWVKQLFLNFVLNHPSELASVSGLWLKHDDVTDEWTPVLPDIKENDSAEVVAQKTEEFEKTIEELAKKDPAKYKKSSGSNIPYKVVTSDQMSQHQIIVKRAGKDYVITINGNPRVAMAINGLTNPDNDFTGAIGKLMDRVQEMNRKLSKAYTTANPNFVLSNFIRDALYANLIVHAKEGGKYAAKFHANWLKYNPATMKVLFAKEREGKLDMNNETEKLFAEFLRNGGETGYFSGSSLESHKKNVNREMKKANGKISVAKAWDALTERLDEYNRAVENTARFAAFVTSRQVGRSMMRSIYDAKEISVNFNKKGSGAKFLGATGQTGLGKAAAMVSGLGRSGYVFWNAGVQGVTNYGRALKRHPVKTVLATTAPLFILGAVIAALGAGDDDDKGENKSSYFDLPSFMRRNNIIFRKGDYWVTLPLPVELRAIYGLGELMSSYLSGKEKLTNKELVMEILGQMSQVLPIDFLEGGGGVDAIIPSSVKPLWEMHENKDFTGLPIWKESEFNKYDRGWEKAYSKTNKDLVELSKWLVVATSKNHTPYEEDAWVDINPAKIEHLLTGYFSGYYKTVEQLKTTTETILGKREFDPHDILLLNRVLTKGDERTQMRSINDQYHKLEEEVNATKKKLKDYYKDTELGKGDYNKQIEALEKSDKMVKIDCYDLYHKYIRQAEKELKALQEEGADESEIKSLKLEIAELKSELLEQVELLNKKDSK